MQYFKIKYSIMGLLILALIFIACSKKDENKEKQEAPKEETTTEKQAQKFSIHVFIDTTKSAPAKVGAMFLKSSLLEGDYKNAIQYLCKDNKEIIAKDSIAGYIVNGKDNPDWDSLTAFKYELTRRYIPVLARMNEIRDIKQLYCKDSCLIQYSVAGPLFIKKLFDTALGEGGKTRFDTMVDSNMSLADKTKFYNHAFERLTFVADSMDFVKRMDTDTLRLVEEDSGWKVCKEAKSSFDIFRQK